MRRRIRFLFLLFGILFGAGSSAAIDFSLKVYSGWSWIDGGDLNASISGWRHYYQDRHQLNDRFTFSYDLAEMHGADEAGGEVIIRFTPRWSVGLGAAFLRQRRTGKISTTLITGEYSPLSPSQWIQTYLIEESSQFPLFIRETIPITLTLGYSVPLGETYELNLGIGAGVYLSSLSYEEEYSYRLEYTEDRHAGDSLVRYADWYDTSGRYTENTTSKAVGLHGKLGLDVRLTSFLFLSIEVLGRWVAAKNWEGNKSDAYEWWHTWGLWGSYSDSGKEEESYDGKLWRVDVRSDQTGNTYPRLVFSAEEPVSSSYTNVRPANINLSGFSIRVGLGLRFGRSK
jgi:hypothetical protein